MAKTANPKSCTRLAAVWSGVERGLGAMSSRAAPPACRGRERLEVSAVTCRQAAMRSPASGFSLAKRSRMRASTGMSWSAQRMRFLPPVASFGFATSQPLSVAVAIPDFLDGLGETTSLPEEILYHPRASSPAPKCPVAARRLGGLTTRGSFQPIFPAFHCSSYPRHENCSDLQRSLLVQSTFEREVS